MATRCRKTSPIWDYYTDLSNGKAKCNFCSKEISYKGGSTFNLIRHTHTAYPMVSLSARHLTPAEEENLDGPLGLPADESSASAPSSIPVSLSPCLVAKRPQPQDTITSYLSRPLSNRRVKDIDFSLLEAIVKNYLPFQIVESPSFRKYTGQLNNTYKLPTRKTISSTLLQQACDVTEGKIRQQLQTTEAVTITTDGWTSNNTESYLCVTAHYINSDMEMCSSLLECFKYSDKHTADNLCTELKRVVREWTIEDKIVAAVSDNAPNILAAIRLAGWRHVLCFAHMLNLIWQICSSSWVSRF